MTCHHSVFSRVWNFIPLLLFLLCQFSSKPWSEYSLLLCLHRLLICLWPFLKTVFQASPNTIHHAVSFSFKVRHRQSFLSVCCGPVPMLRAAAQWKLDQTKPLSFRLPILSWPGGDRHRRESTVALWTSTRKLCGECYGCNKDTNTWRSWWVQPCLRWCPLSRDLKDLS